MDQQTIGILLTIFVGLAAIAMVVQAGMLIGIYRSSRALQEKVVDLVPRVELLVASTHKGVEQSRKQIAEIATSATAILESAKNQIVRVEEVVVDATGRAKSQMDRVELVLDDTISRAHQTVTAVQGTVLWPIRELRGVAAGVKGALDFWTRANRPSVVQATSDEEMFI
ncbi:MAG TPA: hypothetical protein VHD76_19025 [Bryobacteraceae bacterium]|jgi:hypothetical protein|nr:hypothetical protein [Bryobacteraceae bacterium]